MEIGEYPEAIATQRALIMAIDKQIRGAKESMALLKLKFKFAIAADPQLKNENQRSIKLDLTLLEDRDFVEISQIFNNLSDHKFQLEIQLEFLANRFAIAKLELRQRIASTESLSDI